MDKKNLNSEPTDELKSAYKTPLFEMKDPMINAYKHIMSEVEKRHNIQYTEEQIERGCQIGDEFIEALYKGNNAKIPLKGSPESYGTGIAFITSVLVGERATQKEIGEIAGVSAAVVRNRYKHITDTIDIYIIL